MIEILLLIIAVSLQSAIMAYFLKKITKERNEKQKAYTKLLSQKKSSEILLGQITEKLVPFLKQFKHDPQKATFLGQPIDYIIFDDDIITFLEIKSGNSKLSTKQRRIKKLIQEKKVRWEQLNIKP